MLALTFHAAKPSKETRSEKERKFEERNPGSRERERTRRKRKRGIKIEGRGGGKKE